MTNGPPVVGSNAAPLLLMIMLPPRSALVDVDHVKRMGWLALELVKHACKLWSPHFTVKPKQRTIQRSRNLGCWSNVGLPNPLRLCPQVLMIGVPINKPLPKWRFILVRPWLKFWTGLFMRAGLGLWPRFHGWKHYNQAKKERCGALLSQQDTGSLLSGLHARHTSAVSALEFSLGQ